MLKKFLETIFSIKQENNHKKITVLGIKFKISKPVAYDGKYDNLKIKNNKIVFRTSNGAFTCNPKAIAKEVLKRHPEWELVWVVNKNILKFINDFPKNIKLVMTGNPEEYREYSDAHVWIDNERRCKYVKKSFNKKEGQIYIQTFHGSLGIKKTGMDRSDIGKKELILPRKDSKQIDYLISNGSYTTDFFKRTFFNCGKIMEFGHPRNDIFFEDNSQLKEKIYKYYGISSDKKLVLYAPTLREDRDMKCYNLDYSILARALEKRFGGEWVVMVRLHPLMISYNDCLNLGQNVIDTTEYSDIQELLSVVDVVVTDYSSCIYDFMLTHKPGFIYASDVKKYNNGRGLYYKLDTTPFPVAENNDKLFENILNFDNEKYIKEVDIFLKEKGCIDDGRASERVVDLLETIINDGEK